MVKNAGSHYLLSALPVWAPFPAVLKGKIRLKGGSSTNPVAVGDLVRWSSEGDPSLQDPAVISEVLDRKNYVVRKSTNLSRTSHVIAANIDRAYLIVRRSNWPFWTAFWSRARCTASRQRWS